MYPVVAAPEKNEYPAAPNKNAKPIAPQIDLPKGQFAVWIEFLVLPQNLEKSMAYKSSERDSSLRWE